MIKIITIAIATTSEIKESGIILAFQKKYPGYVIIVCKENIPSNVPEQPFNSLGREGLLNRLATLYDKKIIADFYVAVESGIIFDQLSKKSLEITDIAITQNGSRVVLMRKDVTEIQPQFIPNVQIHGEKMTAGKLIAGMYDCKHDDWYQAYDPKLKSRAEIIQDLVFHGLEYGKF